MTEDRKDVEAHLSQNADGFKWGADGCISFWNTGQALLDHPVTGLSTFMVIYILLCFYTNGHIQFAFLYLHELSL